MRDPGKGTVAPGPWTYRYNERYNATGSSKFIAVTVGTKPTEEHSVAHHGIAIRGIHTDHRVGPDLTPTPLFPLCCFLDEVYLGVIQYLVTVRGGDTWIVFFEGWIDLDFVKVLQDGNAITL